MPRAPLAFRLPSFRRLSPSFLAPLAIALVLLALNGCGSSSSASSTEDSLVHIQGSSASITKATLNHWMNAVVGGDYRAGGPQIAPAGLVSEPANYPACEAAARKIVPKGANGQLALNDTQIASKCHKLHQAIKEEALTFLLSVAWTVIEGEEFGLKVSEAQLHQEFARYRTVPYPTEADLQKYMGERHEQLSDVLYQLKRNILVREILPKFEAKVKAAGGGEATYVRLALARYKALIAKTSCEPEYVTQGCREFKGTDVPEAPNVIIEEFVKGEGS